MTHGRYTLSGTPFASIGRQPWLSFRDLEKSHRILDEFTDYNAPYYQIAAEVLCRRPFYPLLLQVEALVYQADLEIEAAQKRYIPFSDSKPWLDRHHYLLELLNELNLHIPAVERESLNLARYWQLENEMMYGHQLSDDLVVQALDLRASDLMMLHHLLHHFLQLPAEPAIFEALLAWEVMLEIEWDLDEYADEVASNDYNTYRMFVKLYQSDAPVRLEAEWQRRNNVFHEKVVRLPQPLQPLFQALRPHIDQIRPRPAIPQPIDEGEVRAAHAP